MKNKLKDPIPTFLNNILSFLSWFVLWSYTSQKGKNFNSNVRCLTIVVERRTSSQIDALETENKVRNPIPTFMNNYA